MGAYHFFRRVVIQGATQHTQESSVVMRRDSDESDDDDFGTEGVIGHFRTTRSQHVKHEIRFARHEHEVIDAMHASIGNSTVVMPPQIVRLTKSIPEWLYPFVDVIDGQIVRERIIERDVSVEDWSKVVVRDVPIIGGDPSIVIGPIVLSGWGPREIQQEQERRQSIQDTAQQKFRERLAPVLVAAAIFLSITSLWLLTRWLQGHGGLLFVVLATGTAVAALSGSLRHGRQSSICRCHVVRPLHDGQWSAGPVPGGMDRGADVFSAFVAYPGTSWWRCFSELPNRTPIPIAYRIHCVEILLTLTGSMI